MNRLLKLLFSTSFKQDAFLLVCSLSIYLLYFHGILFHANSLLSSITGDALKNYYTFLYHIKNDAGLLHFEGMNFPYGEHVVYTDCQPLLAILLKNLPFTHGYLIGILHWLMFGSFVITPIFLRRIFSRLGVGFLPAFFLSLGIAILSPQFAKINGGHHGLAYGCMIPICTLALVRYMQDGEFKQILSLTVINSLLFLLHPYLGFGTSLFSFVTLSLFAIQKPGMARKSKEFMKALTAGLLPIAFFKLFMALSDEHNNRTTEPYGNMALVENPASILAPDFGPFQHFLEALFPNKVVHFEGHSYLGFFTILTGTITILLVPFMFRKMHLRMEIKSLMVAAFVLLLLSFGLHSKVLEILHIKSAALNQFRAACRFAWFFYFITPLFLAVLIYHSLKEVLKPLQLAKAFGAFSLLFFSFNFWEGHSFLEKDKSAFWKFRNFFDAQQLTNHEKELLQKIKAQQPQAILPLPIFCVGSEMYDRIGGDNSMIPSMLLSFHSKTPIMGSWMSRTSMEETENIIQLLNPYKQTKIALSKLNQQPFLVLRTRDERLPDEDRILSQCAYFYQSDSLSIGTLLPDQFKNPIYKAAKTCTLIGNQTCDSSTVVYKSSENKKPFITANMLDYETLFVLDSNRLKPGPYVVSLRYYYEEKNYKSLACNLIISRGKGKDYAWHHIYPMSVLSGFYDGFAVLERKLIVEPGCRYEFFIKGGLDRQYHISDFLIRPETMDVIQVNDGKAKATNNFPY